MTSFNYVSTFLFYIDNNISISGLNINKLFETIIQIIEKAFTFDDDQYDFSNLYALLLILQIFSKNMNFSEKIYKNLLNYSLKCFNYIFENDEKNGTAKRKKDKDLVILGILSLRYIFNPEQTYNFLSKLEIIQKKLRESLYEEIEYENLNFDKYIDILGYINEFDIENELLRKCLILGFCSLLKMTKLQSYLNNKKELKLKLIKIFSEFILYHKNEEIKKGNKLTKDELKMEKNEDGKINNYDDDSESEEEEEDKDNFLDKTINYILESNENIKYSDEYQYFKECFNLLKKEDPEIINKLKKELNDEKIKQLEEVYHIKKLKVNFQGKELEIPRRIVNIKRDNK